jgi:Protein of unknown function (DUF2778)
MRNQVSYPRVRAPRRAHRIVPAAGGAVLSLTTAALLLSGAALEAQAPAPATVAAATTAAAVDLRGALLADLGPYAPQSFTPHGPGLRATHRFIARAEPAPQAPAPVLAEAALRTDEPDAPAPVVAEAPPTPPLRPLGLPIDKTAVEKTAVEKTAVAEPTVAGAVVEAPLPPRRPAGPAIALRPESPKEAPVAEPRVLPPPPRQMARREGSTVVASAPADGRGFFERLFGGAPQAAAPQASGRPGRVAMAYAAAPETGGLFGGLHSAVAPVNPAARYDRFTAIYDISARVVYMPDGSRLEAHSGLREHLDDPRYVHLRMRGATPPHIYNLTPREALFHGVEALRLNPVGGGGAIYGRAGLLAHTYMLGPNGDSNGCVSFRDYNAFLQAYKRGEVRRLAVVAHM